MDLSIDKADLELKARARRFAETQLFPVEVELELNGHLPDAVKARLKRAVVDHGLNGVNHAREHGGQGLSILQQTLVNEELGKATGALWAVVWHPAPLGREMVRHQRRRRRLHYRARACRRRR